MLSSHFDLNRLRRISSKKMSLFSRAREFSFVACTKFSILQNCENSSRARNEKLFGKQFKCKYILHLRNSFSVLIRRSTFSVSLRLWLEFCYRSEKTSEAEGNEIQTMKLGMLLSGGRKNPNFISTWNIKHSHGNGDMMTSIHGILFKL